MTEEWTVRRVLFPTDFSEAARHAGRTAAGVARRFGARLHVLHVVPPSTDPTPVAGLAAAVAELGGGLTVETHTRSGFPAREIVEYAARAGIDLIVIGTHGRTGVSRVLLGSVAEAVVRRAPCGVLTVPGAAPAASAVEATAPEAAICVVCARPSPDLVCETCRARIRGEALERKLGDERPGRRVSS